MNAGNSTPLRFFVAFVSVAAGIAFAAFEGAQASRTLPRSYYASTGQMSIEADKMIVDVCITFYGVVYSVGRLMYRIMGNRFEATELHRWSKWHMFLLNLLGGGGLLVSSGQSIARFGVFRPSIAVGVVLLVLAVISLLSHPDRLR